MVYKSEIELYLSMKPVFKVKERLSKLSSYHYDEQAIWNHLKKTRWTNAENLQLYQIVNDIITLELNEINY